MAIRKVCDQCETTLGLDSVPFLQIHGTITEQAEDNRTGEVRYRYLTLAYRQKIAFCDAVCLSEWIKERQRVVRYIQRPATRNGNSQD
jgi:hypothetical protein